jgi:hypothetical protein
MDEGGGGIGIKGCGGGKDFWAIGMAMRGIHRGVRREMMNGWLW